MSIKVTDDLGRALVVARPPQRIVSLVPSDTHNVIALGARDRLVGCTTYCEVDGIPAVGGTKNVDVEAVIALQPDFVIANQEENARKSLEALAGRVPILVSFPRRVEQGISHLARLARILFTEGRTKPPAVVEELIRRAYERVSLPKVPAPNVRAFIPIWMDPLMTINGDTFGSDVLAHVGVENAFGDRLRLYPLAADLGKAAAQDPSGRDERYPRIALDEVTRRGADLIVLPDEPHAFTAEDEAVLRGALPKARVIRVNGKDLFWYGAWTIDALDRLGRIIVGDAAN
ncbi:MAG: putative periplasmic substrate-binding protein [Myxococcales bacterium]|nr:putative periplasmic substrate-binding protein [Myxococcales bacterium]